MLFEPSDTHHRRRRLEEEMQPPHDGKTTDEDLMEPDPNKALVISSAAGSSSPLTCSTSCSYEVFLSFRGADTRDNFTGHLYEYLVHKGISTFIDDEELRKGDDLSSSLIKAIQGSKISILIFSENYASSSWCLDELVEILNCNKLKKQLVWPVFYKVDPCDVRHQKGKYGEAFAKHERRYKDNMDKVRRWRTALTEASNLSGWTFFKGHEASFTSNIAEQISEQVAKRSYLNVAKYPVGIDSRVQDVLKILDVGGSGVRMVGIWGLGGIGKTTIAKAIFNSIRHKFEGCCFLPNVRGASAPHQGLVGLQNELLDQILGEQKMGMTNADRGIEVIKGRLGRKKVLLILDDVNELNQLEKLAGGLDWFGVGSRIIITTRDKGLLISHQINAIYTAETLDEAEARNLLIMNAFKGNSKADEFEKFPIDAALPYAHGLPLAINILGSLLYGKSINQWHATIDYFRRFPNTDIQKVLETSYYDLDEPLKEAFLDIACFCKGKGKQYVMQALDDSYLHPIHAIEILKEKALISIEGDLVIQMHDLLEDMGKEIVRKESPNDAGRRSRIWFHEDVCHVLTENTGSNQIKGIRVELPREDEICLSAKCFKKMKNLQLFININARFSGEVNYLPNQLRFVEWPGFPAQSLPSDFNPKKLVKLSMPNSHILQLGQGLKNLQNLKSLSFEGSKFLKGIPDLSGRFPNLEKLNLNYCTNLTELHPSVGFLDKLRYFYLTDCCNLETFPRMVNMKSLRGISFSGCKRLMKIPEIEGTMGCLGFMYLRGTAITEVPSSFGYQLYNLEFLDLINCGNLTTLPVITIYEMPQLQILILTGCRNLELAPVEASNKSNMSHYGNQILSGNDVDQGKFAFPFLQYSSRGKCNTTDTDIVGKLGCVPALSHLALIDCDFVSLPIDLSKFINLLDLRLDGCKKLQQLTELPPNLLWLSVRDCVSLERISKLSNFFKSQESPSHMSRRLDLTNCGKLCDSLVLEAKKNGLFAGNDDHRVETNLLSRFLSSHKRKVTVALPARHEISKSLLNLEDLSEVKGNRKCGFYIQAFNNFSWKNTGVGLCVFAKDGGTANVDICLNGQLVRSLTEVLDTSSADPYGSMWLLYIPLANSDPVPRSVPPFQFEVIVSSGDGTSMKCGGLYLVMPPDEPCMQLSHVVCPLNRYQGQ